MRANKKPRRIKNTANKATAKAQSEMGISVLVFLIRLRDVKLCRSGVCSALAMEAIHHVQQQILPPSCLSATAASPTEGETGRVKSNKLGEWKPIKHQQVENEMRHQNSVFTKQIFYKNTGNDDDLKRHEANRRW